VLQQVAVQGINVVEIASTATELILYLDQKDVRLAFDTLYQRFMD
jgi:aspartokinase